MPPAPFSASFDDFRALHEEELAYPSPSRRTLAIEDQASRHIGNVMYYNIDYAHGEAELGITIGVREYWGQGYGTDAVRTLVRHLFTKTALRRIYLKTLDWNERARRCLREGGLRGLRHHPPWRPRLHPHGGAPGVAHGGPRRGRRRGDSSGLTRVRRIPPDI